MDWLKKGPGAGTVFCQFFYSPPPIPTPEMPDPVNMAGIMFLQLLGFPSYLAQGSYKDTMDHLFEREEMRSMLLHG